MVYDVILITKQILVMHSAKWLLKKVGLVDRGGFRGGAGWQGRIQGGGRVVNPTPNIIKDNSVGRKRNMRGNRRVKEMLRQTLKKCCFYQNNKSTLPLHYFCIRPCYKCWLIMILRFCYITTGWINIPCLYDTGDFMKKVPTALPVPSGIDRLN